VCCNGSMIVYEMLDVNVPGSDRLSLSLSTYIQRWLSTGQCSRLTVHPFLYPMRQPLRQWISVSKSISSFLIVHLRIMLSPGAQEGPKSSSRWERSGSLTNEYVDTGSVHQPGILTPPISQFIFTSDSRNSLDSLSVPLHSILSTTFEQPTFSGNYLVFEIKPSPDGGLTDGSKAEVRFKDRPMFEFVSLLEKAREKSIYMRRQAADEADENLRACICCSQPSHSYIYIIFQLHIPRLPGQLLLHLLTMFLWRIHQAMTTDEVVTYLASEFLYPSHLQIWRVICCVSQK